MVWREHGHILRSEDGHVLRSEDCHVLKRTLQFQFEHQRRKGRLKMAWKNQVGEKSMKVGLSREDALCPSKWIVGII